MSSFDLTSGLTKIVSELMIAVKSANTQWMENNLDTIYKNRTKKELLELDLQEQVQLRKAEIRQELDKLAIEYEGKIDQLKMKIDQETCNYEKFLKELDSMRAKIITEF